MVSDVIVQKKTLEKLGSYANERVAAKPSKFAVAQLKKFGWNEGDGLGKNRQGMATHVKVVKKDDLKGIGCAEAESKAGKFTNTWWTTGFDAALSKINFPGGSAGDSASDSSDDSSDDSDLDEDQQVSLSTRDLSLYSEEDRKLFIACGGRRCGKRAGRLQTGKMLREHMADSTFRAKFDELRAEKGDKVKEEFHLVASQTIVALGSAEALAAIAAKTKQASSTSGPGPASTVDAPKRKEKSSKSKKDKKDKKTKKDKEASGSAAQGRSETAEKERKKKDKKKDKKEKKQKTKKSKRERDPSDDPAAAPKASKRARAEA